MAKVAALVHLGNFEEALHSAEEARRVFETHGEHTAAAIVDNEAGITAYKLGDYARALTFFDRAQETYGQASDANLPERIYVELNRPLPCVTWIGLLRRKTLPTRPRNWPPNRECTLSPPGLTRAWRLHTTSWDTTNEALKLFKQARQVFASSGLQREVFVANLFTTNCHLALNRYAEVLDLAAEAERELTRLGIPYEEDLVSMRLARAEAEPALLAVERAKSRALISRLCTWPTDR